MNRLKRFGEHRSYEPDIYDLLANYFDTFRYGVNKLSEDFYEI